jgi:hypothetical protein
VVARCNGAKPAPGKAPRVTVERRGARLRVALREPREPLAWAVDAAYEPSRPFVTAWHSERVPGARARPVARDADIDAGAPDGRRALVAVRVWYDDGRVGTSVVEAR